MEMFRSDWPEFEKFGQVYITGVKRGVVKAWHYHKIQNDHFICVYGKALVVLYDMREDSPTKGEVNEFKLAAPPPLSLRGAGKASDAAIPEDDQILLKIPKGVAHGFCARDCDEARIVNVPTELYNYETPDEHRYPWNTPEIPYQWPKDIKMGG